MARSEHEAAEAGFGDEARAYPRASLRRRRRSGRALRQRSHMALVDPVAYWRCEQVGRWAARNDLDQAVPHDKQCGCWQSSCQTPIERFG